MFQQSQAAFLNIAPRRLEVSRVPWVGNIAGAGGIVHQQMDLALGVAKADAAHIFEVLPIHANDQVVLLVIGIAQPARGLAFAADAVLGKLLPCWGIDRVADLLGGCRCRRDVNLFRQPRFPYHVFHHEFRHRVAADVPVTHKEYPRHALPPLVQWS